MTELLALAQEFPTTDESAWRALVDATLKGADFDKRLVTRTADGVAIQPLYAPGDASAAPRRIAASAERPWDLRVATRHPDPAKANAELLKDLEGGAASVLLAIDPSGAEGVAIGDAAGMRRALDGLLLDLAPVALEAGWLGPAAADWLAEACPAEAAPAFHLDPLSAFARSGSSPGPVESHLVAAATTAVRLSGDLPNASLFLASGRVAHEAGGGEAHELGFALAAALAYAKALARAGMPLGDALPRIVVGLSADADYFLTISKLRAARLLWAKLASALDAPGAKATIEARSSRRMLTAVDPWVNLLRLTGAGFGAAAGGADAVILDPFTDAIGLATTFARRQARNTQLVLMEESHLGRVADPAGGAGYIETLTDQLARAGWRVFQGVERAGGIIAALEAGDFQREVAAARDARRKAVASRKSGLVGVSEFPNLVEAPVAVEQVDASAFALPAPGSRRPGPDGRCESLTPIRWSEPFEALRNRAGPDTKALVALLGPAAEHSARLGFASNLLSAGGVTPVPGQVGDGGGYRVAVIAGSDERYAAEAADAARALKAAGVALVLLAGRPGELEAALKEAGVDLFVFAGGDALADLQRVHAALGTGAAE